MACGLDYMERLVQGFIEVLKMLGCFSNLSHVLIVQKQTLALSGCGSVFQGLHYNQSADNSAEFLHRSIHLSMSTGSQIYI